MAEKKSGGVAALVRQVALPVAEAQGVNVWDVRYEKEGGAWYLRIFIDKPGGVNINDCENVSRAVDSELDALDPIDGSYCLEVSSPGIERDLVRDEHFAAFIGHDISLRLIRPQDGVRDFTGELTGYENGAITIRKKDGETVSFVKKDTAFVRLYEDFKSGGEQKA